MQQYIIININVFISNIMAYKQLVRIEDTTGY